MSTLHRPTHIMITAFAGVIAVAFLLAGNAARSQNSAEATAGGGKCLECHEYTPDGLLGTGHQQHGGSGAVVPCLSCHPGADGIHSREPDDNLPFNPASAGTPDGPAVCISCHPSFHAANLFERDPHTDANLTCDGCHRIHNNDHIGLLVDDEPGLCYECHASVEGDFFQPFRHPVRDNVVRCSDCHRGLFQSHRQGVYAGSNTPCYECHARFQGPYPFQHQATVDYSTEEGGCLNCHAAHGSDQPRMLKQPYDVANQALCAGCHLVPRHEMNNFHGTQWAGVPCSDCHVDIHGSYTNRNFLRSSLQVEGCFLAGCHTF